MVRRLSILSMMLVLLLLMVACDSQVEEIKLSKSKVELKVGDRESVTADIIPEDATEVSLTWESSDSDVVTVKDGSIKAVGEGTAEVTAEAPNGVVSTVCKITVIPKSAYDELNYSEKEFFDQFTGSGAFASFKDPSSVKVRSVQSEKNALVDVDPTTYQPVYKDYYFIEIAANNSFGGAVVKTFYLCDGTFSDSERVTMIGKVEITKPDTDIDVGKINKALEEYVEEKGY